MLIRKDLLSEQLTSSAFEKVSLTHLLGDDGVRSAARAMVDTTINQLPDDEIPTEKISMLAEAMQKVGVAVEHAGQYAAAVTSHVSREYTDLCHLLG